MISFDGVSKSYRTPLARKVILNDVSLVLTPGRNLGVLGINGAGKSTLLRLIAGSEMPDRGRITRYGRVSFPLGFSGSFHGNLSRYYVGNTNSRSLVVSDCYTRCCLK